MVTRTICNDELLCNGEFSPSIKSQLYVIVATVAGPIVLGIVCLLSAVVCLERRRERLLPFRQRSPLVGYQYRQVFRSGETYFGILWFWGLPHQQKPFFLDVLKILVEFTFLLLVVNIVDAKIALIMWAVFDQLVFVYTVCLWVAMKRSLEEERTGRLTLAIYIIYCISLGVPFGFAFKVTSLDGRFPLPEHLSPLYIQAFALLVLPCIYFSKRREARLNFCVWVLLSLGHCGVWIFVFYTDVICRHFMCSVVEGSACAAMFYTRTMAFLPVAIEVFSVGLALVVLAHKRGETSRFAAEASTLFSGALVLLMYMFMVDTSQTNFKIFPAIVIMFSIVSTTYFDCRVIKEVREAERMAIEHLTQSPGVLRGTAVQGEESDGQGRTNRNPVDVEVLKRGSLRHSLVRQITKREHTAACPICMDDFRGNDTEIMLGVIKSCGHYFHLSCVLAWLDNRDTCPICRGSAELSEDGIRAISYHDLHQKTGIRTLHKPISAISKAKLTTTGIRKTSVPVGSRDSVNLNFDGNQQSSSEEVLEAETEAGLPDGQEVAGNTLQNRTGSNSRLNVLGILRSSRANNRSNTSSIADGLNDNTVDRNNRRCHICNERYEDNPQFMVVGYLPECGHFFHFRCIWNFMTRNHRCPICTDGPETDSVVSEPTTPVRSVNVLMALLSDVLTEV